MMGKRNLIVHYIFTGLFKDFAKHWLVQLLFSFLI